MVEAVFKSRDQDGPKKDHTLMTIFRRSLHPHVETDLSPMSRTPETELKRIDTHSIAYTQSD